MAITIFVNGVAISYPQTGDPEWGDDATDFAIQTAAAFLKLGLSTGTSVDIPSTLDVTGATKLDSTLEVDGATQLDGSLTVAGTTTLNGTANLNGNTNIGNANTDTIAVTGILNVDTNTLYVNPTDNRVGINTATPTVALDVVGSAAISGTLTAGTFAPTDLTVDTNLIITNSTDNRVGINTTSPTVALDVTGDVKQSGVLLNSDGTVSAPSISFTNDTNTGLYRIGSDEIGIATNGILRATINSNGIMASFPYWNLVDQKNNGTSGGNTVAATWTKRSLNTTIGSNTISGSSVSSDVITLPVGTYRIFAISIFLGSNTKIRLRNTSDAITALVGTSLVSTSAQTASNVNNLLGIFTIASTKNFELQYYSGNALTNGLGSPASSGEVEIYSIVELWKLA